MTAKRQSSLQHANAARPMNRRVFMQSSLCGAAALSLSGCASRSVAQNSGANGASAASPPVDAKNASETWIEPWVWRPRDWPGQQLDLNVVENENPGPVAGFGNPNSVLFSYGGDTPGPTIRMRGDETLHVRLRNMLGPNLGKTAVGPNPDPNELPPGFKQQVPANLREDFCLGEHTNGIHSAHVTNLHTHGLHVKPDKNSNGTHSDNVILRVIPQADYERRQERATDPACGFLRDPKQITFLREDEQVGQADYEFRLGRVMEKQREALNRRRQTEGKQPLPPQPHPAGTFWYHPHCHGATHNQVASGMAGFLIVEGDVDDATNLALTGVTNPDPELKAGDYDYRERLMLIQRVFVPPTDPDAPTQTLKKNQPPAPLVNGNIAPAMIVLSPGAIERWRVLNGSVDGRGFKRFMVLEGQFKVDAETAGGQTYNDLKRYDDAADAWVNVSLDDVEKAKQNLWQLAWDGIALVRFTDKGSEYYINDLSKQNAGTRNPLTNRPTNGPNPNQAMLENFQDVFKSAQSVKDCYVRPNEVYLGPANRTDLFFRAPSLTEEEKTNGGKVFTVLAKAVIVHADNYQQKLQGMTANQRFFPGPEDVVVAYLVVKGAPVKGGRYSDILSLKDILPPVQPYLSPVQDDELRMTPGASSFRTRTLQYSGWGSQDYPLITTDPSDPSAANFRQFIEDDQRNNGGMLEDLIYAKNGVDSEGKTLYSLLPAALRSMSIDGRKFSPMDPQRPRMLLDTAEEWCLYNQSGMLWGNTDAANHPQPGQYKGHYTAYPISRAEGQARFKNDNQFRIVTKGVDHPFHIHQNPFWVLRVEIPDENGDLHNILDEPRWMDTIWIPRHGGRVVFRARFPDYVGAYVNHCHILMHEDNGMMQVIEVTPFSDQANCAARPAVASTQMSGEQVSRLYPRISRQDAYVNSASFVDPNMATGQTYPGFDVVPPKLS